MATTKRPRRQLKERTHRLLFNELPLILPREAYEVSVTYGTIEDTNSSCKFEQKKLTFICDRAASVVKKANKSMLDAEGKGIYQYHESRFLSYCGRFMVKNLLPTLNEDERLTLVVKIHPSGIYYLDLASINIKDFIARWLLVDTFDLVADLRREINKQIIARRFS